MDRRGIDRAESGAHTGPRPAASVRDAIALPLDGSQGLWSLSSLIQVDRRERDVRAWKADAVKAIS